MITEKIVKFIEKETVLTVAWLLALLSAIIVHPSLDYVGYIDFRSLGILWSLMVIMQGLSSKGFFDSIGQALLKKTKRIWQLVAVLVFLCFFLSMFITNDVALLTFVPFAMYILHECDKDDLLIPVIVLQTLAANLGSMLTPVGNPQNLYLYGLSGMALIDFIKIMLPYSAVTFVLLCISIAFIKGKTEEVKATSGKGEYGIKGKRIVAVYGLLFLLSLLVVVRLIPYYLLIGVVLVVVFIIDKSSIKNIDYALLFTFVGFFIFTGNLGNIDAVKDMLTRVICGHEVLMGVISSQAISNVPAALLLSPFTDDYKHLIIGVNLGGLGTLIASMASLISFKLLAHKYNELKGKYFLYFTFMNILYLAVLLMVLVL